MPDPVSFGARCALLWKEKTDAIEAIELTKRFLAVMGKGECEIRQMHDVPAFAS